MGISYVLGRRRCQPEPPGTARRTTSTPCLNATRPHRRRDLYAPIEWETAGEYEDILYDSADGIAKITINRPERRNAFRPPTLAELRDAFNKARDDLDVGSIILTGAGDQAFCSGGDQTIRGDDGYIGDDEVATRASAASSR